MRSRAAPLVVLLLLAGCLGQAPVERTSTTQVPTETGQTAEGGGDALGPADCQFHSTLPDSAVQMDSPGTRNETPSPPSQLTNASIRTVAVEAEAATLTGRLRNRSDVTDFGIGPGTTTTAAAVTNRSDSGACVVVRVPYYVETESSVADGSSVATYFVNGSTVTRAG